MLRHVLKFTCSAIKKKQKTYNIFIRQLEAVILKVFLLVFTDLLARQICKYNTIFLSAIFPLIVIPKSKFELSSAYRNANFW